MRRIILIAAILQVVIAGSLKAQIDPHFSQYYAYPMWLNPALTGVINGDARVTANYKNQYADINNAYKTTAVSADMRTDRGVGLGLNILNQAAGDVGFNYFTAYANFAYSVAVSNDENQRVSFGLQAGIINRSFDQSKLQLGNQYDPITGFNPGMASGETFSSNAATVFDAGAGVFYYDGDPTTTANLFGGLSVGHLSRPKDPFAAQGTDSRIPIRYTFQAGLRIKASDMFDITPHAIYIRQQNAQEKALGAYSEIKLPNNNGLIIGAMYRFQDAAIANVGYDVKNFIIGASYDFNTSSLNRATNSLGGAELSISYVFRKRVNQPDPICPRL
ncbi:PorP/SprF family type IX secretion system membrane protein [Mucilaginibacter sp. dw_454]|uniref:PorP/SprF family type IX secretion system membrane protein n=1 Tax=Mucilaginibacter sp. dw_454 TaxID=2720079 RepID=UPI001BD2ADBD|nr:PorP/SprF family type IX secretion system membrane protein [Mucilaginibacter sp. dw_454]